MADENENRNDTPASDAPQDAAEQLTTIADMEAVLDAVEATEGDRGAIPADDASEPAVVVADAAV